MLDLDLHLIYFCCLGIALEGVDRALLGQDDAVQLLDLLLQADDQSVVISLDIVLEEHLMDLLGLLHSINRKLQSKAIILTCKRINVLLLIVERTKGTPTPIPSISLQQRLFVLPQEKHSPLQNNCYQFIITVSSRIEFFHRMKQKHIFQLIQPNSQPSQNTQLTLQQNNQERLKNIFGELNLQRTSEHDLQHSKSYDVVGIKELKSYKNRGKKRTKGTFREDPPSEKSISRESNTYKKTKTDLLNKEEVIECLPRLTKESSFQHMKKIQKSSWLDLLAENSRKTSIKRCENKKLSKEFSVFRLKNKLNEHEKEWKKLFINKNDEKYPSLEKSIVLYQSKLEEMAKKSIDENLVNIKSSFWTNTLRNNKQIDDICFPKRHVKTLHSEGVKAKGFSKLISETDWIQYKDDEGFKFKNYPQLVRQQTKLKISLR